MTPLAESLRDIYLATLDRCSPERLVREAIRNASLPFRADVVAIGKCAAALLRGTASEIEISRALAVAPAGYPASIDSGGQVEIVTGSHPQIDEASFAAGRRLVDFVSTSNEHIVFLVSGGASACAELPLAPWFDEAMLRHVNSLLVLSGLPIGSMNVVRKHLSSIKGGRLATRARCGSTTLVYSDVSTGRLDDVGSGPTLADTSTNEDAAAILDRLDDAVCRKAAALLRNGGVPDTPGSLEAALPRLVADNATLVSTAARIAEGRGLRPVVVESQIEGDVDDAARGLSNLLDGLAPGEVLCAGGEPTVTVLGAGVGGRCSELAVRFARHAKGDFIAVFASSDGVDGNTGAAGAVISSAALRAAGIPDAEIAAALDASDSFSVVHRIGGAIIIPSTGNNLRDLYLLARG